MWLALLLFFASPVLANGWDDGTMSAGFWVMIGLSIVIVIILLLLFACYCCMPIRGASERFDALPGEKNAQELYGNPRAYDATMHRVSATPVFSVTGNKNE